MNRAVGATLFDVGDHALLDAVDRSEGGVRARVYTDRSNLLRRQLARTPAAASQPILPIAGVAGVAPGVQVTGVDAGGNIAGVADQRVSGDWADPMFVGEAMGVPREFPYTELPVPTVCDFGEPEPASVGVDLRFGLSQEAAEGVIVHEVGV